MEEDQTSELLSRIDSLERELQQLKRAILHILPEDREQKEKPSLFGSIQGEDIPEEEIERAKRALLRDLIE